MGFTSDVSVIVVTFNSAQWIERCLESVRGHETIVVDHGSTDGTLEIVRRRFPEARVIEVDWLFGACLLVRRDAADEVGLFDEDFFMFSEETDWCYRFRQAGWSVYFFPGAEVVHVGGASHGGSLFAENVRGHLRFFAKHRGTRQAERARRLLLAGVRLRLLLFRGKRRRGYHEAARWLSSGKAGSLLRSRRLRRSRCRP